MTGLLIPAGVLVVTVVVMVLCYWTCVRPLRAGRGCHTTAGAGSEQAQRAELAELRRELAELQHPRHPGSGSAPGLTST